MKLFITSLNEFTELKRNAGLSIAEESQDERLLSVSHCRPTRLSSVVKKWPFLFVFLLTQSPKSFLYHPPFHLPLHDVAMKKKKKK